MSAAGRKAASRKTDGKKKPAKKKSTTDGRKKSAKRRSASGGKKKPATGARKAAAGAARGAAAGVTNVEIAETLETVADLLEIQGANFFKIRAYREAARTVRGQTTEMAKMVADDVDLTELPAIGDDISGYIRELVATGRLRRLDELAETVPLSLTELLRLPDVGAKTVKRLWEELGVETLDDLENVARAGQIKELKGFGEKTERQILERLQRLRERDRRMQLGDANEYARALLSYMSDADGVDKMEIAGSYRRRKETIGDLDLLVVSSDPQSASDHFVAYPQVAEVRGHGDTRSSVVLKSGLQVDLRVVRAESYGAALVYFTGSKAHNIKLRQRAIKRGLRISEYGVFREPEGAGDGDDDHDPWSGEMVAGATEEDVYDAVDLPWMPPELREDRGEIEAAAEGDLPRLVDLDHIRGDLQMHSTWSDGDSSIEEMVEACEARGYEYLAITDHSQALAMIGGLDAERLRRQWEEIAEVAERHPRTRILRSMEIDILKDGRLDLEDELVEELDLVMVSIHTMLDLDADAQTRRIVKALEHPEVDILAHPTGRLINERAPMAFDLDQVLACAADNGVAVELNANPKRLDLKDDHLIEARKRGLRVAISTDAHKPASLDFMRYGVEQARRAWLTPDDVLNTLPVDGLLEALRDPRDR